MLTSMTFKNNVLTTNSKTHISTPIPDVEFSIEFVGATTGLPTLLVNGNQVTSSTSSTSSKYWSAYVDGAYGGLFDFKSNQCYTLKGIGGSQNLCVTINPNYKYKTDAPTIQYNVNTKTFTIGNNGSNCSLKISSKICCIYKDTNSPR